MATVYVSYLEDGAYSDYSMWIEGVFASLEDAQAVFPQTPYKTYWKEFQWEEWEVHTDESNTKWTQQLVGRSYDSPRRAIVQCLIGKQWGTEEENSAN